MTWANCEISMTLFTKIGLMGQGLLAALLYVAAPTLIIGAALKYGTHEFWATFLGASAAFALAAVSAWTKIRYQEATRVNEAIVALHYFKTKADHYIKFLN